MKRTLYLSITPVILLVLMITVIVSAGFKEERAVPEVAMTPEPTLFIAVEDFTPFIEPVALPEPTPEIEETDLPLVEEWVCPFTDEEVDLIALLTMAEAEGEPEYGQRLVIDSVLNRRDDPHFPDTIYDVVYQKNQYSSMHGDRVTRCWVKEDLRELVRDEMKERTDYDVVFFRTEHYHKYGVPMFQVGHHYFSKYE